MHRSVKNKRNKRASVIFAALLGSFSLFGAAKSGALAMTSSLITINPVKFINNVQVNKAMRQARQTINDHQILHNSLNIATLCVGAGILVHKYKSRGMAAAVPAAVASEAAPLDWGPYLASFIDPVGWGKWSFQLGALLVGHHVVGGAVQYIIEKIEHDDSILWFKIKQTSYSRVIEDLIGYAEKIEKNKGTQEERKLHKDLFVAAAGDLVSQIEKIVGYMRYKGPLCDGKIKMAATLEKHMIEQTNSVVKALNACIAAGFRVNTVPGQVTSNDIPCSALLKEYQQVVDACIDDFARLDPDSYAQRDKHRMERNKQFLNIGRKIDGLPAEMREKIETLFEENEARLAQEEAVRRARYEEAQRKKERNRVAAKQQAAADRKQGKAGMPKKR